MGRAEAERLGNHLSGVQSEQMARKELANILTPEQFEAFLLRYSQNANSLRAELGALRYFNVTREEFRRLFLATDVIYTQLGLLAADEEPNAQVRIQSLQKQQELAIRGALTPQRYAEYVRLKDPAYLEALTATLEMGGKVDLVKTLYSVNQQIAAEQARIHADTNLTDLQRQIELRKVDLTQLEAQAQVSGQMPIEQPTPELPPTPDTVTINSVYSAIMGDDLKAISERYRIPMSAIRAANPGLDLDNLLPGDRILLPEPPVRQSILPFGK
jgi:LysM repeat protein